jgi:iron complex outermembrane receptor protein
MKGIVACMVLVCVQMQIFAQDLVKKDSSEVLEEVMVHAYETNRKLIDVPAAVTVLNSVQLARFSNTSLVPAINTSPGVRMEERSPGSYRLNIRGSSLRSPFGVRNVKVYYNGIPYTDPGGNTYFNQLGFYNISSMEIVKGPGSSLYGAGTGGAILLKSESDSFSRGASIDYTGGSYGSNSVHLNLRGGSETFHNSVNYLYQNSDGYRDHTRMERKTVSWDGTAKVGTKGVLRAHFLQGTLFYQTPGALTQAEYDANPKASRPRSGATPGADEAHAAITQKLFIAGFNYSITWNEHWQSNTSLYGAYSKLENPTTRNYERRTEPHFGSRNVLQYSGNINQSKLTVQGGLEIQQEFTASRVYQNKQGNPDTLQTDNEITNSTGFGFLQASLELKKGWIFTAGFSVNVLDVELTRLSFPTSDQKKNYNNQVAPRVAVLKKITPLISAYGSVARGFSPPTSEELLPSTGVITGDLEAEEGWNTEAGARGNVFNGRLYFDVNIFYFRLQNTIAQRRDASGGDYFVNSGSTNQNGTETFLSYRLTDKSNPVFDNLKIWASHTWSNFHYKNFQKVTTDTADYSGKRLPSIPKNYLAAGLDMILKMGAYANITYYYSDPVALNDANSAIASSYNLLGARIGFRKLLFKNISGDIFAAADNIFNEKYSLGNDINALGGRYFNAAPGANYAAGVSLKFNW